MTLKIEILKQLKRISDSEILKIQKLIDSEIVRRAENDSRTSFARKK